MWFIDISSKFAFHMEKVIIHPLVGEVTIKKNRRNKNIRISVRPGDRVCVSIPTFLPYSQGIDFLEQKKTWVIECIKKLQLKTSREKEEGRVAYIPNKKPELEKYRKEARKKLETRLREIAERNNFTDSNGKILVNHVHMKRNISNWGSCSNKNNINLNMCLIQLPEYLQDYVILHELCHLRYRNHSKYFHQLLDSLCNGKEKIFIKELRTWRLEYSR